MTTFRRDDTTFAVMRSEMRRTHTLRLFQIHNVAAAYFIDAGEVGEPLHIERQCLHTVALVHLLSKTA